MQCLRFGNGFIIPQEWKRSSRGFCTLMRAFVALEHQIYTAYHAIGPGKNTWIIQYFSPEPFFFRSTPGIEPGPQRWKARVYPCAYLSLFSTYGVMLILSLFSLQLKRKKKKKKKQTQN